MKDWREVLESDEMHRIKGKAKINFEKAAQFKEACELLDKLQAKGLLEYTAEDPRNPYSLHAIQIRWKYDDGDMQTLPPKELAEILERMDYVTVVNGDEWIQLSSVEYG